MSELISLPRIAAPQPLRKARFLRLPDQRQVYTFIAIVVPFVGLVAAPFVFWGWGFSWIDLGLLITFYLLTGLGITVGFHRLFTHRSFETHGIVKFIFAVLGSMSVQGPIMKWVAMHRRHHQHSDTELDPHSPCLHGTSLWGTIKGALHSHVGWFFCKEPDNLHRYVQDLYKSAMLRITSNLFVVWVALSLLIPAALGGLLSWSWSGVLTGMIWGGLVRIFLVHHVTWSVNSACHIWGRKFFPSNDESRDNLIFGVLALGEGWHNTHHAFPSSARHGLRWWQIDISYYVIRALEWTGLAWDVRLPTKALEPCRNTPPS